MRSTINLKSSLFQIQQGFMVFQYLVSILTNGGTMKLWHIKPHSSQYLEVGGTDLWNIYCLVKGDCLEHQAAAVIPLPAPSQLYYHLLTWDLINVFHALENFTNLTSRKMKMLPRKLKIYAKLVTCLKRFIFKAQNLKVCGLLEVCIRVGGFKFQFNAFP